MEKTDKRFEKIVEKLGIDCIRLNGDKILKLYPNFKFNMNKEELILLKEKLNNC